MGVGIDEITNKWNRLDVKAVLKTSLEKQTGTLEQFQIGQLILGQDREGEKIGKYKSPNYAKYKFKISTLAGYGFIDLRLYGDYYAGMVAEVLNDRVMFYSKDEKNDKLNEAYDPLGLNPVSIGTFNTKFLAPEYNKQLNNELRRL